MKSMTCKDLGGACDMVFHADTFEEIAAMSKRHAMEMFQKGDQAHLQAMKSMQSMMQSQEALNQWMAQKKQEFESMTDE